MIFRRILPKVSAACFGSVPRHFLDCKFEISGIYIAGVTPLPIPNREVKPRRADGTIRVTVWESRSMPDLFFRMPRTQVRGILVLPLMGNCMGARLRRAKIRSMPDLFFRMPCVKAQGIFVLLSTGNCMGGTAAPC